MLKQTCSDSLLHVAAGELGSLLVHSQVQSGWQRTPSRLAEEAHTAGARGESALNQNLFFFMDRKYSSRVQLVIVKKLQIKVNSTCLYWLYCFFFFYSAVSLQWDTRLVTDSTSCRCQVWREESPSTGPFCCSLPPRCSSSCLMLRPSSHWGWVSHTTVIQHVHLKCICTILVQCL